jgi:hypothetical protein
LKTKTVKEAPAAEKAVPAKTEKAAPIKKKK